MCVCSVGGGTLQDLLVAQTVLNQQIASSYTYKLAKGLEYLHEAKIILVNLCVSQCRNNPYFQ